MRIILKIIGSFRPIVNNCKGVDMEVKNKRDVPKIRFNIYRKRWKKKKFKDFTKLSQGLQIAISDRFTEDAETRHFYITNEFLNPNSRKKYYIESPSENVICTVDDILMTRTGNTGKVITNVSGAFHNNFFKVTYEKNDTAKLFLYYLLLSYDVQKEILIRAGNSTIPDLNHGDFYSIKTFIPTIEEQSAIGSLFRTLDYLLASYKDNLANYQSLKVTMLSKMFPKVGQTVPEIRLDGFEGEWENKILSEVTNITMGQSPKSENYTDNPNDYILVQGNADIKDKQVVPRLWTTEVTKMAEIGDIILTVRAPVGDIGKTDYNVVIGRGVAAIKGNDFIFYTLEKMKMTGFWNKFSTGSTFESISSNDIKEAIIQIPTLEEQQAIGAYFSNLDNLINSYQEKISQLETLKKKLLQDMFI